MPKAQEQVDHSDTVHAGGVDSPPAKSALSSDQNAGARPPTPAASIPADSVPRTGAFNLPRNHRRMLVQMALLDIYGPNGLELGEIEESCHRKVDEWLRHRGKRSVSKATLRRAKRELNQKFDNHDYAPNYRRAASDTDEDTSRT
jgi:hypothetical protein